MIRGCDVCGRPYEAKRVSSRFCSGTCRKRNLRAPRPRLAETSPAAEDYSLLAATRAELEAAGRLDSMLGQVALLLAERMCDSTPVAGQPRCQRNCAPSWPQRSRAHRRQPILLMS